MKTWAGESENCILAMKEFSLTQGDEECSNNTGHHKEEMEEPEGEGVSLEWGCRERPGVILYESYATAYRVQTASPVRFWGSGEIVAAGLIQKPGSG